MSTAEQKRADKLKRLSIRDGLSVAKDERQQEKWKQNYDKNLSERYSNLNDRKSIEIIGNYKKTEVKYGLYLQNYLRAKHEKKDVDETDTQQELISELSDKIEKLSGLFTEQANTIADPVIRKLILNDLTYLKESQTEQINSISELLKELSLWNEYIEREEALNIAFLAFADIIDLELSVFASVNHESKNTEVSLIRRTLTKKHDKSIFFQKIIDDYYRNNTSLDDKSVVQKIVKSLEDYYKVSENKKIALVSIMSSQDAKKRRKILLRASWFLGLQKFVRPVLFTIGVVALFVPVPFIQLPALALIGISVGAAVFPVLTQFLIGKKLLPDVDSNAEHFVKKSDEEIKFLKERLKATLSKKDVNEYNKLVVKSSLENTNDAQTTNTIHKSSEATIVKPKKGNGIGNYINKFLKSKLAARAANSIKKDESNREEWLSENNKLLEDQYNSLNADSYLKIIDDHKSLSSYYSKYYDIYLKAKKSKKNENIEIYKEDNNASSQHSDTHIYYPYSNSEEITEEIYIENLNIKNKLNEIKDPVIRKLIDEDLECLSADLPEEIKDLRILIENLSKWNEYIEREEAKDIAYFGIANLIELDLSVFATVKHEIKNTTVSLMRRTLEKMSDKFVLLENQYNKLKNHSNKSENSTIQLIDFLESYYQNPENKKNSIIARMATLNARKEIKVLRKKGLFLALSKMVTPVLFTLGIVALFSGFPPLQIIGAGITGLALSRVVKIPSILFQFHIGKKVLPNTDHAIVQSSIKHREETQKIEEETGINLDEIRGYNTKGLDQVCGCCLNQNLRLIEENTVAAESISVDDSVSSLELESPHEEEKKSADLNEKIVGEKKVVSSLESIFGTSVGFFNIKCRDPNCAEEKCNEESDSMKKIRDEMASKSANKAEVKSSSTEATKTTTQNGKGNLLKKEKSEPKKSNANEVKPHNYTSLTKTRDDEKNQTTPYYTDHIHVNEIKESLTNEKSNTAVNSEDVIRVLTKLSVPKSNYASRVASTVDTDEIFNWLSKNKRKNVTESDVVESVIEMSINSKSKLNSKNSKFKSVRLTI